MKRDVYYQSQVARKELRVHFLVERTNFKVVRTKAPANVNNKNEAQNVIKTIRVSDMHHYCKGLLSHLLHITNNISTLATPAYWALFY